MGKCGIFVWEGYNVEQARSRDADTTLDAKLYVF